MPTKSNLREEWRFIEFRRALWLNERFYEAFQSSLRFIHLGFFFISLYFMCMSFLLLFVSGADGGQRGHCIHRNCDGDSSPCGCSDPPPRSSARATSIPNRYLSRPSLKNYYYIYLFRGGGLKVKRQIAGLGLLLLPRGCEPPRPPCFSLLTYNDCMIHYVRYFNTHTGIYTHRM